MEALTNQQSCLSSHLHLISSGSVKEIHHCSSSRNPTLCSLLSAMATEGLGSKRGKRQRLSSNRRTGNHLHNLWIQMTLLLLLQQLCWTSPDLKGQRWWHWHLACEWLGLWSALSGPTGLCTAKPLSCKMALLLLGCGGGADALGCWEAADSLCGWLTVIWVLWSVYDAPMQIKVPIFKELYSKLCFLLLQRKKNQQQAELIESQAFYMAPWPCRIKYCMYYPASTDLTMAIEPVCFLIHSAIRTWIIRKKQWCTGDSVEFDILRHFHMKCCSRKKNSPRIYLLNSLNKM